MGFRMRIELTEDVDGQPANGVVRTIVERDFISAIYQDAGPDMVALLRAAMFAAWQCDFPEAWDCERCRSRAAAIKAEDEEQEEAHFIARHPPGCDIA